MHCERHNDRNRTYSTDPDKDLLLLLGFIIDAQRAVFLGGRFVHPACAPPPPTKQLNGVG